MTPDIEKIRRIATVASLIDVAAVLIGLTMVGTGLGVWIHPGAGLSAAGAGVLGLTIIARIPRRKPKK